MHQHATLIQKSICPDSIVSNSNSTVPFRRLFQHYRPEPDISRIEIPQRSSLLSYRAVLSLGVAAQEGVGSAPPGFRTMQV
jgi:hypothetical protein